MTIEEITKAASDGARFAVSGYSGIAFYFSGVETEPDEDTEWSGIENETGMVTMVMVGDDYKHSIDPDDISALGEFDYCSECGQIGCTHDGRDRD